MNATPTNPAETRSDLREHLRDVRALLARHRLVEGLVHRQEMPRHELVETLVHKQNLAEMGNRLARLSPADAARLLAMLEADERPLVWGLLQPDQAEEILRFLTPAVRATLGDSGEFPRTRSMLNAFELHNGRLRQIAVESQDDLANTHPIWVDLIDPTAEERRWIKEIFALELPALDDLSDLEASARFYVDDDGEVHLHSDFLLDKEDESRNVAVAFVIHRDILFSVRAEELPVFRLQRLRARTQPGYVTEGKDVLLDLYAADAEYSADALEEVYVDLEAIGRKVLNPHITDQEAALILSEIARGEDLNGRIRRNVLDTRRALSFLMRSKFLSPDQFDDARQILRDIESLDGHTTFLFGKINFLMDATVGFININQNQRVSKLTTISVIFMPINILAGIGGMSEFSMMTKDFEIGWPVAYAGFVVGSALVGWATYHLLRYFEGREARRVLKARELMKSA